MSGPFTTAERQKANYVGRMLPIAGKPGWFRIVVSALGSTTSLIMDARPDDTMGLPMHQVLGRLKDTPEQRDLKRREG